MSGEQYKLRRDTRANVDAYTQAEGEAFFVTDKKEGGFGDAARQGGYLFARKNFREKLAPSAIAAQANDYAPSGLKHAGVLALTSTGAQTITGVDATAGRFEDGSEIILINFNTSGGAAITLAHQNAGSTAANRIGISTNSNVVLEPGMGVTARYAGGATNRLLITGSPASLTLLLGSGLQQFKDVQTAIVQLAKRLPFVKTRTTTAAPGSPSLWDLHIVPSSASGAWAAFSAGNFAMCIDAAVPTWVQFAPDDQQLVWSIQDLGLYYYQSATWSAITAGGGAVPADLDILLGELALQIADNTGVALFLGSAGNRFADSFKALTYVDVAGATNLNSGTVGLLKPTTSVAAVTSATRIGDATNNGGLAAAFNGTVNQSVSASAWKTGANASAYIGLDLSAAPAAVGSVVVTGANDGGLSGNAADSTVTVALYGKSTAGAPASGTDGTLLGSWSGTDANSVVATATSSDQATLFKYIWVLITDSGSDDGGKGAAEVAFAAPVISNNVTVTSTSLTATSAPATMKIVARVKEIDAVTLNTDLIFEVTRDGGTTWTAGTMTDRFVSPSPAASIHILESNAIDVTAQPSGTSCRWRCRTQNNKTVEIHDIYLYWT